MVHNFGCCYFSNEHKLEFLIGDTVLPYNMTVYQAVKQFGEQNDADTDTETPLGQFLCSYYAKSWNVAMEMLEGEDFGVISWIKLTRF